MIRVLERSGLFLSMIRKEWPPSICYYYLKVFENTWENGVKDTFVGIAVGDKTSTSLANFTNING